MFQEKEIQITVNKFLFLDSQMSKKLTDTLIRQESHRLDNMIKESYKQSYKNNDFSLQSSLTPKFLKDPLI